MSEQAKLEITEAEWEVMDSVWEGGPQTPAEIIARVQPIRERSHRTIRTLLNRLVDKGAVRIEEASGKRFYAAAVSKDACIRAAAKSFRERFFDGSVGSLFCKTPSGSARLRRRVRVVVTEHELGPAVAGCFRPVILLPGELVARFSADQLQTILRHEYAHIRRWDPLLMGLCKLTTIIHWFNPLVYWNARMLRREIELAVDAAVTAPLDQPQRRSYAKLLLELAQRPGNQFGLVQMASRHSQVGTRINALLKPQRSSWLRSTIAVAIIGLLCVTGLSQQAETEQVETEQIQTQPQEATIASDSEAVKYAIVGRVTDAATSQPVADAEVGFLVESAQELDKRAPKCRTDVEGNYRIEVPMGEVKLWFPWLKPGYWLLPEEAMVSVATTPENPETRLDIRARKGAVWQVQGEGELGDQPFISSTEESDPAKRAAWLKGESFSWDKSPPRAFGLLDANGRGELTQVGASGALIVGIVNVQGEIVADPLFDNTQVVSAEKLANTNKTELVDQQGRKAVVTEATVSLKDGVPLLRYQLKSNAPIAIQKLTGRVVDEDDQPVANARVGLAFGTAGAGSAVQAQSTTTNAEGSFQLEFPIASGLAERYGALQFSVFINKDKFAAVDTPDVDAKEDFLPIDFGTIQLANGYNLPVAVVDAAGKPVPGAVVEPGNTYSLRYEVTRTDVKGEALLKNLPRGLVRVSARYGNQAASTRLVVSDVPAENTIATIRLAELVIAANPAATDTATEPGSQSQRTEPLQTEPLPVATPAPEWLVGSWSDGKQRSLADYRGKIVVLDFWGLWCGPCINMIPAMQSLAETFEPRGVVFLGIHTAHGDMQQIIKLKKSMGWETPSAIDNGTAITESKTADAYGVSGFPSIVIIDGEGKVAFHSGIRPRDMKAFMADMEQIAKANAIEWPLGKDLPEDEMKRISNVFATAQFSAALERILKAQ
ncbi:M56 family metallopeptidase [Planctomycetaceae bacterium SH139]